MAVSTTGCVDVKQRVLFCEGNFTHFARALLTIATQESDVKSPGISAILCFLGADKGKWGIYEMACPTV